MPSLFDDLKQGAKGLLSEPTTMQMVGMTLLGNSGPSLGAPRNLFEGVPQAVMAGNEMGARRRDIVAEDKLMRGRKSWLAQTRPDLAQQVEGGLDFQTAYDIAVQEQFAKPEAPKVTDDMAEYNFAVEQGFDGSFTDFMHGMRKAGATSVTVDNGSKYGTIPQGWELFEDPETGARSMRPIDGGPAAMEAQQAQSQSEMRAGNAATASDVVTTAAKRARDAAAKQNFGPGGTTAVASLPVIGPMSDSGEVVRQVEVLRNSAAAENLNAMRRSSPTGGALGNVTERELKLLSDMSGALDPNSPNFLRDLEDYERTLLRVIHGHEAGDAIFESTREQKDDGWIDLGNGVKIRKKQ